MAQTSTRRAARRPASTSRNGGSPNRSNASSRRTPSSRRASQGRARKARGSSPRAANRSRSPKKLQSPNGITGALSGVGDTMGSATEKVGDTVGNAARKAGTPALVGTAAAAGVMGGLALGSRVLSRGKATGKVPTPKMPTGALKSVAKEVQQVGKEITKTGFRLGVGDVSVEVQSGKKQKETRDSPLEVLLTGLTARRSRR